VIDVNWICLLQIGLTGMQRERMIITHNAVCFKRVIECDIQDKKLRKQYLRCHEPYYPAKKSRDYKSPFRADSDFVMAVAQALEINADNAMPKQHPVAEPV